MELLNWFKKPINWWIGLALVINGTWLLRDTNGWEHSVVVGGISVVLGLILVMVFGRVDSTSN
jgi:hypothetical protein